MGDAVVNQQKLDDGTVVVELRGELDLATNDALRAMLVDLVKQERPPRIVVDLLHVSFVDSTGIGALVAGYDAAIDSGVDYGVRAVAPFVERQLRLTGVYGQLVSP